ncbi:glutathione synthase [Buchnera aphidicola (Taiwanaphis decaspermi)]|uniref:glutathione synthase n=1 Tax=Buchnera aphidicola TaxID=9 RepID=UPI0031B890F7
MPKKIKIGIIMDSINNININKDSSFAILLESQKRNFDLFYIKIKNLFLKNNVPYAISSKLNVSQNKKKWFNLLEKKTRPLSHFDVILMRKEPPVNQMFIYATYILEISEKKNNTLIINKPKALRDYNEKIFASLFYKITPKTLITSNIKEIKKFWIKHKDIILKPLNGMGGESIFRIKNNDYNFSVISETMTNNGNKYCVVQKYIPDIKKGDKRVLIINKKIIPFCLARIPKLGENRGNLAKGGIGKLQVLNENDYKIAKIVSSKMKNKGLFFMGLDIIGKKLIEINITSPTCICEISKKSKLSISSIFLDELEKEIKKRNLI